MINKSNPYIEKAVASRPTSGYSNYVLDKFKRPTATKFCEVDFQGDTEQAEDNILDCSNDDAEQPEILAIHPSESPLKLEDIGGLVDTDRDTANVPKIQMNHELQDNGNNNGILPP